MSRRGKTVQAIALSVAVHGCATSTPKLSVYGRPVEVLPTAGSQEPPAKGELIAVGPDRLWVLEPARVSEQTLSGIREVRVRRHGLNGRRGMQWALLGALVTGGALTLACASVEDADNCGVAFLGVAATWALIGGLSARSLESSSRLKIRAPDWEALKPYARFPQGIPEGLDLAELLSKAPPGR